MLTQILFLPRTEIYQYEIKFEWKAVSISQWDALFIFST